MEALNVTEKIMKAYSQINGLIDRYKNSETVSLKKQDVKQIFESISSVVDNNHSNKDQVKQYLFSYLRYLNKILCTNADIFRSHVELENQITHLRNFIIDEISNVEKNTLGICATVVG